MLSTQMLKEACEEVQNQSDARSRSLTTDSGKARAVPKTENLLPAVERKGNAGLTYIKEIN